MVLSRSETLEILGIISIASNLAKNKDEAIKMRKKALRSIALKQDSGFKKVAFDTRRIDQEEAFNPRRGARFYQRSEPFVSEGMEGKLKNLLKLHEAVQELKQEYGKEFEWQDSNARILLNTLDNGLRIKQGDGDFSESQPAQGGLNYIEQLLYVRYKLGYDEISTMSKEALKKTVLAKDEMLTRKDIYHSAVYGENKHSEIIKTNQDNQNLIEKLFGNVKASKENPNIERTVTITIKDRLVEG